MKKEYLAPFSKMVNIKVNTRLLSGSDKVFGFSDESLNAGNSADRDEEDSFGW